MSEPERLVGAIIRNEAGEVLLLHRSLPGAKWWEIPGGKRKPGEVSEVALERELGEELGVSVAELRYLSNLTFEVEGRPYNDELFEAFILGRPRAREAMHDAVAYFPLARLATMTQVLSVGASKFHEALTSGAIRLDS